MARRSHPEANLDQEKADTGPMKPPRTSFPFPLPVVCVLLLAALTGTGCASTRAAARGGLPDRAIAPNQQADSTSTSRPNGTLPSAVSSASGARGAVEASPAATSVEETIHDARSLFDLGVQHYQHGEMREARAHFDRAIERLTSAPGGARSDVRLADAYADLLNDIQELETSSYQDGTGLSPAGEPPPVELLDEVVPELSPEQAAKERELAEKVAIQTDLPVVLNDRVLAWLDIYQGTLRDRFQEGLTRSGRYLEMIRSTFREEGLPEDLAYIAHVESAYKPHAYSRARAKGLWQFIVGTGTRYGLRRDWWVDERSDPELATRAAAAYLKDLYAMFGDWYLAMAAYNAGEGKIQRVIERTGVNDFWAMANTSQLRLETKNYVPAILAAILISKNPGKFGFDPEKEEPFRYDRVSIGSATDLGVVAKLAATTLDVLRDLNPSLTRLMTPPNYPDFELHVPMGTGERFSAA